MTENGHPHEHVWRLHKEDSGRSYLQPEEGWDGGLENLAWREVTIRVFYCEICRLVQIDREYSEDTYHPFLPPPRPRRRFPWLPVTWRPW